MIKMLFDNIISIDKKILHMIFLGLKFSLVIALLSCYILALYNTYPVSHVAYLSGLLIFKLGLTCASAFFICGFAVDKIKN